MENSESGSPVYSYNEDGGNKFKGAGGQPSIDEISDHQDIFVGIGKSATRFKS